MGTVQHCILGYLISTVSRCVSEFVNRSVHCVVFNLVLMDVHGCTMHHRKSRTLSLHNRLS
jgi:hypothetical protein